jgi:general secretion pathway protein M
MNYQLSPQSSKAVAILLLLLALATVYAVLIEPVIGAWSALRGERVQLSERLARYNQKAADRPRMEEALKRLSTQVQGNARAYVQGATSALAAATLQDYVKQAIESSGGRLVSAQSQESKRGEDARRISITVQLTGNMDTVQQTLHTLESGEPRLWIDNLTITRKNTLVFGGKEKKTDQQVDARFEVYGYQRPATT